MLFYYIFILYIAIKFIGLNYRPTCQSGVKHIGILLWQSIQDCQATRSEKVEYKLDIGSMKTTTL